MPYQIQFIEDTTSYFKNPGMGWTLYLDLFPPEFLPDAEKFWCAADQFLNYFSILYIRICWSVLEPEEGKYAWINDKNYITLTKMAAERGIKLAFSVCVSSMHADRQATPQYVRDCGAQGYMELNPSLERECWDPYVNDSVFQAKLENFLDAFARQYDCPDICDYIDGNSLGWWGETHHLEYLDQQQKKEVYEWIVGVYASRFKNVLLCDTYQDSSFSYSLRDWAIDHMGYMKRRDSLGSPVWFPQEEKDRFSSQWPSTAVFGENCYHHITAREDWWRGEGHTSIYDMLSKVLADAKEVHCNTLDLRVLEDANQWLVHAPDLVDDFLRTGGYRLVPEEIFYPEVLVSGKSSLITHTWKNTGVGKLPNDRKNWAFKYKVAVALIDQQRLSPVYVSVLKDTDPGQWIKGVVCTYHSEVSIPEISEGKYHLAIAIVDTTKNDTPAILLAVGNKRTLTGWYTAGMVDVINPKTNLGQR